MRFISCLVCDPWDAFAPSHGQKTILSIYSVFCLKNDLGRFCRSLYKWVQWNNSRTHPTKCFCVFVEVELIENAKLLFWSSYNVFGKTLLKWFLKVALNFFYLSKCVILCVYMCLNMSVCLYAVCKLLHRPIKEDYYFLNLLLLRHSGCIWEWGVTMVTVSPEQRYKLITMVLWEINALREAQQQSWSIKLHPFNIKCTCVLI